jgi:hypothetical protein
MAGYDHAPEPWRDPPPAAPPRQLAQDPHVLACDQTGDQSTEFSFGPGPAAPHLNGRPPSEGGIYMPRSPRVDPPASRVGRPRQHRRPPGEARGDAGEQVAR